MVHKMIICQQKKRFSFPTYEEDAFYIYLHIHLTFCTKDASHLPKNRVKIDGKLSEIFLYLSKELSYCE